MICVGVTPLLLQIKMEKRSSILYFYLCHHLYPVFLSSSNETSTPMQDSLSPCCVSFRLQVSIHSEEQLSFLLTNLLIITYNYNGRKKEKERVVYYYHALSPTLCAHNNLLYTELVLYIHSTVSRARVTYTTFAALRHPAFTAYII